MTVAHDAATESTIFTTADPFTFNHTPVGTPKGVLVFIISLGATTDRVDGAVTYGGVAMTRVNTAVDSSGELARVYAYFLGSSIPTGTQTVSINHDANAANKQAVCITVTAAANTEIGASGLISEDAADPQIALDTGATSSLRYCSIFSGGNATTDLVLVGSMSTVAEEDYGINVARQDRQTTASSGSFTVGYTRTIDDVAMVAVAIQEAAVEVTLTGNQPAASGTVTAQFTAKHLAGNQPAATGTIANDFGVIEVNLAGNQPSATGTIDMTLWRRKLAGSQPAASGTLVAQFTSKHLRGNQPAASGTISSFIIRYVDQPAGISAVLFQMPDGSAVDGLAGHVFDVLEWETVRKLDEIGNWHIKIPSGGPLISGRPLADRVQRGWLVSLWQENNRPMFRSDLEYLMYQGVVEAKRYSLDEPGQSVCELAGSFRAINLAARSTPTVANYDGDAFATAAADIEGGLAGGITVPSGALPLEIAFGGEDANGVISRYARLLALGGYGRMALRETWELDALEFVKVDDAPVSRLSSVSPRYVIKNVEAATPENRFAGQAGFALIGGTPKIRREGAGLVNMVIPFGSDFDSAPLTLETSTQTAPYFVQGAVNPDGGAYYYLSDAQSIETYGRVEMAIYNTAIKNPSDNAATRSATADVLYAWAVGELLRNRSPKVFIEIPIANGAQVWALPGDRMPMEYDGVVLIDGVRVPWQTIDQWFLVVERVDRSDPSGVRQVSLTLAAPEIEIHLPGLPDAVILPVTDPGGGGGGSRPPGSGAPPRTGPGTPGGGPGITPDCCDDPTTTVPGSVTNPPTTPPPVITTTIPGVTTDGPLGTTTAEDPDGGWRMEIIFGSGTGINQPGIRMAWKWTISFAWGSYGASPGPQPPSGLVSGSFHWGDGTITAFTNEDSDFFFMPGPDGTFFHDYDPGASGPYECWAIVSGGVGTWDTRDQGPGGTNEAFP